MTYSNSKRICPNHGRIFQNRRASVTVEAAIMLPLLIGITLGSVDIAQYVNLSQLVSNGSRVGARIASRDDTRTVSVVEDDIRSFFYNAFPQVSSDVIDKAILISVTNSDGSVLAGNDLSNVASGEELSVRVIFNFEKVRWLHGLHYFDSDVNESISFSRRE